MTDEEAQSLKANVADLRAELMATQAALTLVITFLGQVGTGTAELLIERLYAAADVMKEPATEVVAMRLAEFAERARSVVTAETPDLQQP